MIMLLKKGKNYQAEISLNIFQRMGSNSDVEKVFMGFGFANVKSEGSGSKRLVSGMWPGETKETEVPKQIVTFKEL